MTTDPAPDRGARRPQGERTRARLVVAAKEVFAEHGLPDARIADITRRAGLSYGVFYHYFDSKEALFREIAEDVASLLHAPVEDIILQRGAMTPQDRLRHALRRYFESYRDEARFLSAIEQATRLDDDVRAAREEADRRHVKEVADSIALLQRRGLGDPNLDPGVAAAALGAMTSRFAELWLAQDRLDVDFDTAVDTFIRLFIGALGLDQD
jgi:AcrR family transcriptional regulator